MRHRDLQLYCWTAVLLSQLANADSSPTTVRTFAPSTYSATTTLSCSSTTINYITHNLPQQCLRTSWSPAPFVPVSVGIDTSNHENSTVQVAHSAATTGATATSQIEAPQLEIVESIAAFQVSRNAIKGVQSTATFVQSNEPSPSSDSDLDSPLDDAKFLSFEEWKKQNLAQAGANHEEKAQAEVVDGQNHDRANLGFENALESMGDEGKIDIDISGFGGVLKPVNDQVRPSSEMTSTTSDSADAGGQSHHLSRNLPREAGKTHKERSNYASFDCGAKILKTNPRCKSATSVLSENKDSYMLHECSVDNKFFIVELCDEILIDTVVLANFEFFSSIFRTFRVSVSNKYPVRLDKWITLGTYEARNTREIQAFLVENSIWARFFRVEFLSHYGNEYYCPLSLLRVHGMNEREDLRRSLSNESDDDDVDVEEPIVEVPKDRAIAPLKDPALVSGDSALHETKALVLLPTKDLLAPSSNRQVNEACPTNKPDRSPRFPFNIWSLAMNSTTTSVISSGIQTCVANHTFSASKPVPTPDKPIPISSADESTSRISKSAEKPNRIVASTPITPPIPQTGLSTQGSQTTVQSVAGTENPSTAPSVSSPQTTYSTHYTVHSSTIAITTSSTTTKSHVQPNAASSSNNPPNSPDSFFKSTNKRLQSLESSATLSLQYIESQSRLLRDAFNTVSSRQLNRTSTFLGTLNSTVTQQLLTFRTQYDQLWQSTVLELAAQKDEREREVRMLGARMELLAAELGYQRRVGIAQTALLVLCLGIVIFSHRGGGSSSPWDVSLARNMRGLMRGRSGNARWESPWNSPPRSPPEKQLRVHDSPVSQDGALRPETPLVMLRGSEGEAKIGDTLVDPGELLDEGQDEEEFRDADTAGTKPGLGLNMSFERPINALQVDGTPLVRNGGGMGLDDDGEDKDGEEAENMTGVREKIRF